MTVEPEPIPFDTKSKLLSPRTMARRHAVGLLLAIPAMAIISCGGIPFMRRQDNPLHQLDVNELIKREADYILSCQYLNQPHPAYGALNNVHGEPTWVVPRENGLAILGLIEASKRLQVPHYLERANLAADYLVRIQDQNDGGWFDQYKYEQPALDEKDGKTKSPTQPAEVMMAFHKLGYKPERYDAMKKGASFILACQDVANKTGNDDGLVGGGKDENGQFQSWRWTSDNSFSHQALRAAEDWSRINGDISFAEVCKRGSERILDGINRFLKMPSDQPIGPVWHRAVDASGKPMEQDKYDWINYAPQMLDVPVNGVGLNTVGAWIHQRLQQADGACIQDSREGRNKKSPGFSFQASLVWLDLELEQMGYADSAKIWALKSDLWQTTPDENNIQGGWVDWIEDSKTAPRWQRFIDTSFYAIAAFTGGYNFNINPTRG